MLNIAYNSELTISPFREVYFAPRLAEPLLADAVYSRVAQRVPRQPVEVSAALVPEVTDETERARFESAVERWQADIVFDSFSADMKDHESFAEIVAGGFDVVPLIAAHIRRQPSFLFLALEEIFGHDPVPEEAYGNVQTVAAVWLEWLQR